MTFPIDINQFLSMSRYRSWCFTVDNCSDEDEDYVFQLSELPDFVYVVCAREVGEESNVPQLHGHVYFRNKKTMKQVSELLPRALPAPSRGPSHQYKLYCFKGTQSQNEWESLKERGPNYGRDAQVYEFGNMPRDRCLSEQQMALALARVRAGNADDVPANMKRYMKAIEYRVMLENVAKFNLTCLEGPLPHLWIHGYTGNDNSAAVRRSYPGAYMKSPDKWWDHYAGEDVILFEDLDRSHARLLYHLKQWGDRYPFPAEFRGGSFPAIRPRKVIITSNYHPRDIWSLEQDDYASVIRRFSVIPMSSVYAVHQPSPRSANFCNDMVRDIGLGMDYKT